MKFTAKLFSTMLPASDGSMIPYDVAESFFNSQEFKEALKDRKLFGTLTHLSRNLASAKNGGPAVSKTIGKDDLLLLIGESSPTHVLTKVWFENDGWCYGEFEVLSEDSLDDEAIQRIRRVKGLLKNGCKIGISCVILGYWENSSGSDYLKKMVALKGADLTLNPSWKNAGIVSIDNSEGEERTFSELDIEYDPEAYKDTRIKVKQFSVNCEGLAQSSKIDGKYTRLIAKDFSFNCDIKPVIEEISDIKNQTCEKSFSVTSLRERVRENGYSVRQRFRLLVLSYKQLIRQMGGVEKIKPETLKIMKSLFTTDLLDIMKSITPDIMAGKNPGTLLGASSLGKNVRVAVQQLFLPYKMALSEVSKTNAISKNRYQKIQEAYMNFTNAMIEEVFGSKTEDLTSQSDGEEIKEEPEK